MSYIKTITVMSGKLSTALKVGDKIFLGEEFPKTPIETRSIGHIIGIKDDSVVVYFHFYKQRVRDIIDYINDANNSFYILNDRGAKYLMSDLYIPE